MTVRFPSATRALTLAALGAGSLGATLLATACGRSDAAANASGASATAAATDSGASGSASVANRPVHVTAERQQVFLLRAVQDQRQLVRSG